MKPSRSGGLPFVAMVEPADFGPRYDPSGADRIDGASIGRVLAEREVRSRVRVVRDVRSKHAAEMSLIDDDDVVQTLATDRPDDAFDVGILPGRAWRGADGCQTERFGGAAERRVEGRVTVVQEESRGGVVREALAKLLAGPRGCRLPRHVEVHDAAPIVGEDDEDEEDPAGECGDCEEVDRDRGAEMVLKEGAPALRGWPRSARHLPRNRPLRDLEPQLQQFPMDARRAPEWVRDGHLPDQASDVGADPRPADARARSARPVPRETAAMPGDDRRGSDDHQGRLPVPPCPSQSNPEQPIGPPNGGFGRVR